MVIDPKSILKSNKTEQGQDLAEYAIMLGLIALVVFVAVILLGDGFNSVYALLVLKLGEAF